MTRYENLFKKLAQNREAAFVPFSVLGDPTLNLSYEIIRCLIESGADAIELGIPFSDPVADGPAIQAAMNRALFSGVTPDHAFALVSHIRSEYPEIPIGLLVYANLLEVRGESAFCGSAKASGVDSILVADLPVLEAGPFAASCAGHGIDPVFIVPPNIDEERLRLIARTARGYTYVVSRRGTTGVRENAAIERPDLLRKLKDLGAPPALVGFGISRTEHVRAVIEAGASGAIAGSAVSSIIEENLGDPGALLKKLSVFVREMKSATRV